MGATGSKEIRRFPRETQCDHDGGINCMAAAEDHSLLATGSEDKTARVWDVSGDKIECIGIIRGHTSYITCICVYDTYVFTGSADNTVRKWDAISCNCLYTFTGHESRVTKLLCTGEYLLSSSMDDTVRAWHIDDDKLYEIPESEACIGIFEGHERGVCTIAVVPGEEVIGEEQEVMGKGDMVITGSLDFTARSWDFVTKKMLKKFVGHTNSVTCLAVDSSVNLLYTGSSDKTIRCWDYDTAVCYTVMEAHQSHVLCLLALKKLLYSGDGAGMVQVWELQSRDKCQAYYNAVRRTFTRYQPKHIEPLTTITQHRNTINGILLHDGILYTACSDNLTRGFDVATREMVAVFTGHKNAVTYMAICGNKLYTASSDTTLMVWDLARHEEDEDSEESSSDDEDEGKGKKDDSSDEDEDDDDDDDDK